MPVQKVELQPGMIATICRNTYNHEFAVGQDVRLLAPLCGGGWTCESLDGVNKWSVGGKDIENPRYPEKVDKEGNGWISVSNPPNHNNPVLGLNINNEAYWIAYHDTRWNCAIDHDKITITHWQPLPSPPTKS